MPQTSDEVHFATAARRHHDDAVYLHDGGRLPNADHHFGFAVECALKSMLLRSKAASMGPKPNGKTGNKPWVVGSNGQAKELGHLPTLWSEAILQVHGRSGGRLSALLTGSGPFNTWDVGERYLDGTGVVVSDVNARRAASAQVLLLHQQAVHTGVIP